jgi:methyltransferase (TIGR00027 family)
MTDSDRAASGTAEGVAMLRAAHMIVDGKPPILDDAVIVRLSGPAIESLARDHLDRLQSPEARGLRSHVVLRSRFAEDCLERAVERGVRQYVLLGAGLDTFAYRQPAWARALAIIEVDQPASQAVKRRMLRHAAMDAPSNVRFGDIDFERESLADGLARHGVDASVPTFFSWLGVTMYLQRTAIETTLRTVAAFPPGSEIVLTFAQPLEDSESRSMLAERAAQMGEPWVSYFMPAEMEALLRQCGFSTVEFLDREEAMRRYYQDRADGLEAPRRVSICRAVVAAPSSPG